MVARERLIAAVSALVERKSVRDIKALDVTREAGVTPSSFYRYFGSVDDVLLAAISSRAPVAPELIGLVRQPWTQSNIRVAAFDFAHGFLRYWDEHFHLLKVRNLAADEGKEQFVELRWEAISPLFTEFESKISRQRSSGRIPSSIDPGALTATLFSSLERLGAGARQLSRTASDYPLEKLAHASAYLIVTSLGFEWTDEDSAADRGEKL